GHHRRRCRCPRRGPRCRATPPGSRRRCRLHAPDRPRSSRILLGGLLRLGSPAGLATLLARHPLGLLSLDALGLGLLRRRLLDGILGDDLALRPVTLLLGLEGRRSGGGIVSDDPELL